MKAIVNVNKNSYQALNNFKTFEVKEILSKLISLDINGTTTDFSHKEAIIVDIELEFDILAGEAECMGMDSNTGRRFKNLQAYCTANSIVW